MSRKTFPSFTFVVSSHRESFALPDYYRPTRHEQYGPYYREPGPPQDLMKTIDHRGQDTESSLGSFLPDIFEEDETEVESDEDHHVQHTEPTQRDKKTKQMGWVWRLFLSVLLKYRGRKAQAGKNVQTVHFNLNA